jgi:hypothetical protein
MPISARCVLTAPAAQVAQLVEHVTENHGVGGSIPPLGTIIADIDQQNH